MESRGAEIMLKIAICDDEEFYCEAIMSYLQKIECEWKDEFEIVLFKRGEDLCKTLKNSVLILFYLILSWVI